VRAIFLDFDGVLHSTDVSIEPGCMPEGSNFFRLVPKLATALRPHDVHIVISSAWAGAFERDAILGYIGIELAARVIGDTSAHCFRGRSRYRECELAAQSLGITDWVMIDDNVGIVFGDERPTLEMMQRVFFCDPILGLDTMGVIDELGKWLEAGRNHEEDNHS